MNKLFVYGTLKSKKVQVELLGKELNLKTAEITDYALYEAEDGFYFIKKEKNKSVKGYILEIDDYDLKICDAYEMCPTMYQRKKIKAMCNNEIVQAYVYVRVDEVGKSKFIENFESYCGFNEDEFIATEIKHFKTKEHPEFYL
ncbi:MAG: gamma-glutamylcyclotransferase [Clostridiales bacterium]|nr:gamma-glutamylcyclotransferase [Clostridiales bacterium]